MSGPHEDTHRFRVLFWISDTTPDLRRYYRTLRRVGLSRYDANLVTAGICIGTGEGKAEIRRVEREAS